MKWAALVIAGAVYFAWFKAAWDQARLPILRARWSRLDGPPSIDD